ncbi:MAG: 1-deoxy-D-xylulose-5-phosphate synthase [Gammaproteobacteria bacterium]|nr:1-deoxy-D-xylulose-5-phosphate synthase [Gammaproteobacteria bacterium]
MVSPEKYPLLAQVNSPAELRELPEAELKALTTELREFLVETVSKTGGHLSAGLGTVELTLALHKVFNTPEDRLVWDVGHQSYPHKIITGRRDQMNTMRQHGGLSGFPKREESEYDTFGVGHSSTSISAALGMALAAKHREEERKVIAVIGDGAMTAGMAFEALNHAGDLDANLLVILNDNEMSISPNVGALSNYFAKVLAGRLYSTMREGSKKVLSKMPPVWDLAQKAEEHVKGMVVPGTLFEEMGFNYIGPIDGHDLPGLVKVLENMSKLSGPQFLHIMTKKGKGYPPAEENPIAYHGIGAPSAKPTEGKYSPSYTEIFGQWLNDVAEADERMVAITPAMREGSGMVEFSENYPERYYDVGIAEQHAVTLAAGLACEELKPVVAIYSTFLQRAYDQLIHDIALQNLPVMFAIDRAGLVGPDGPTHAGMFDLSYLRCIPNMVVMAPANENECRQMLTTGFMHDGPSAVRYPRGKGPGTEIEAGFTTLPIGKANVIRNGSGIAILSFGAMLHEAEEAAKQLNASLVNMRFVKPIDAEVIKEMAFNHQLIITLEDNVVQGGAGSAVNEVLAMNDTPVSVINMGLPDQFVEHGTREELLTQCGLDAASIIRQVEGFYQDQGTCDFSAKGVNSH